MDSLNLSSPDLYLNRELSLLEFNRRVLEQAKSDDTPLLERLRFLCIASSNLDEFFEIRVAGLKQQEAYKSTQRGPDDLLPAQQLEHISRIAHDLVDEQYEVLNNRLIPSLREEGIYFRRRDEWSDAQRQWVKDYFLSELAPILSPIALDPAHPFPRLINKSLSFIVLLDGQDAFGRKIDMAVVQAPRALPRVIRIPADKALNGNQFVFLTSIIHAHVGELFQGMRPTGCYQFRVTRNSDLFFHEEEITDLLRAVEGELSSRRFGDAVRLELAQECPSEAAAFLEKQFGLSDSDIYRCNGPVNLMRLNQIPDLVDRSDLKFSAFTPGRVQSLAGGRDAFAAIRSGDLLLHHPFQSFTPVIDVLRQAAQDPDVVSIRQTLYRTGPDSEVVEALTSAAKQGKEVLVVIELRARFDEAENIELATELQDAGVQVVYGVVGYKTHAKMILIIRREGSELRRYVHLGTGNYHPQTARLYTDYGLFSCDQKLGMDVQHVFRQLTSMGKAGNLEKIVQAPFALHSTLVERIETEIDNAKNGTRARVIAKLNHLVEPSIIRTLYRASQAGVQVDLIIRGVCALRPGIPQISENITVRSIIGRFLEHTRVYYFENGGSPKTYLSSADWMPRNLFNRVETCFPIEDEAVAKRVFDDGLQVYLDDNCQSWLLQPDGSYAQPSVVGERVSAQATLLNKLAR